MSSAANEGVFIKMAGFFPLFLELGGPVRQRTANKVFFAVIRVFLVVFYAISYRRKGS